MADKMFFSDDHRSLRKGRRNHPRTDVSRPVVFHPADSPDEKIQGRLRNLSRDSALLESPIFLPIDSEIELNVQKDDKGIGGTLIQIKAIIARADRNEDSIFELGLRLVQSNLPDKKPPTRRPRAVPPPPPTRKPSRMHILDIIVGE